MTRHFVSSFYDNTDRTGHTGHFLSKVKKKKITKSWLMEEIFFDQPIRRNIKACENIREIATGQGDDYTTKLIVY